MAVRVAQAVDHEAGTGPPLPFSAAFLPFDRGVWEGQSMLGLRY